MSQGRERAAAQVVARRGELGLTQRQLAMTAEVDIKTIYNLESGERWPQAGTRAKIEKALSWAVGSLEAFAEGRESGYQYPTIAELIDDGLRRGGLTAEQVRAFADIGEYAWARLTSGSATIGEARQEDPSMAAALARAAIYLGITAEQLSNAGQEQAAKVLRDAMARTSEQIATFPASDPRLRQLIELWPRLSDGQRDAMVRMVQDVLALGGTSQSPGKPEREDERRTG